MAEYDYLIVGSGLFGAVFAHEMRLRGKRCLVIEKRKELGGNVYTEKIHGIHVHKYGPHIFHTNNEVIWQYVNRLVPFKQVVNSPVANYRGELYNLPFNMNTFYTMWGVATPCEAEKKLAEQRAEYADIVPSNLEEQALKLVGYDIYTKLIKGYTEKQWGKKCTELPADIIRRLPVRLTFDNNYFNDKYQGIPFEGYNGLLEQLLVDVETKNGVDYFTERSYWDSAADKIVFTGCIDQFFDYKYGHLEYRSLRFEDEVLSQENYQGVAVMNFTAREIPYTRITEHKHFLQDKSPRTVITREYSQTWRPGMEPYYPVNDTENVKLYQQYAKEAQELKSVIFGGRLGTYKYYNMDQVVEQALNACKNVFE